MKHLGHTFAWCIRKNARFGLHKFDFKYHLHCLLSDFGICVSLFGLLTRIPMTSGLNNRDLFSQSAGGWKSKTRLPLRLASGETSLPSLQMAPFLLCPYLAFFCVWRERERGCESERRRSSVSSSS